LSKWIQLQVVDFPQNLKSLILACLQEGHRDRPTAEQLFEELNFLKIDVLLGDLLQEQERLTSPWLSYSGVLSSVDAIAFQTRILAQYCSEEHNLVRLTKDGRLLQRLIDVCVRLRIFLCLKQGWGESEDVWANFIRLDYLSEMLLKNGGPFKIKSDLQDWFHQFQESDSSWKQSGQIGLHSDVRLHEPNCGAQKVDGQESESYGDDEWCLGANIDLHLQDSFVTICT
jgi:hypothetical protein